MCGIVCVISKRKWGFSADELGRFEQLLYIDTLRGDDSTGVFLITNDGNVEIIKEASDGPTFLKSKEWGVVRQKAIQNGWAIVGHNRKATRGTITDENAHPFWVDNKTVLVHNGTMFGDHKKHADTAVDSHAIAHVLSKEEDVEMALQSINAAYALIWYDVPTKRLNLVRNNQRPLAHCADNNAWYICSETMMLDFVLSRTNTKVESTNFPAGCHHIWELQSDKSSVLSHTTIDLTPKQNLPVVTYQNNFACAWEGYGWDEETGLAIRQNVSMTPNVQTGYLKYVSTGNVYEWQTKCEYQAAMLDRRTNCANKSFIRIEIQNVIRYNNDPIAICNTSAVTGSNPLVVYKMKEYEYEQYRENPSKNYAYYAEVIDHIWKGESTGSMGYLYLEVTSAAKIHIGPIPQQVH